MIKYKKSTIVSHGAAGGLAEKAISTIRTVKTLNNHKIPDRNSEGSLNNPVEITSRMAAITFALIFMVVVLLMALRVNHTRHQETPSKRRQFVSHARILIPSQTSHLCPVCVLCFQAPTAGQIGSHAVLQGCEAPQSPRFLLCL